MRGLLTSALLGAAAAVLLSSCGGASETGATSEGTSVITASAGGLQATLSLTPESLPDGVSLSEVELEMLVAETIEPGAPMLAVRLLPDDLVLEEPATLTVGLPDEPYGSFMAIHTWGDSMEILDGEIRQVDGVASFVTSIEHFSGIWFEVFGDRFFDVVVSHAPERVTPGETAEAWATITAKSDLVSFWFKLDHESAFREYGFSAPSRPTDSQQQAG